jgi:predicted Zn-dependent protease with MMP-like domain
MDSWPYRQMNAHIRRRFDALLEQVLDELPPKWRDLLEQVPLVVEDRPSRRLAREMNVGTDEELCGLYSGIPLTERSVEQSGSMPDQILIFRAGILAEAANDAGRISDASLKRQIRITLLHEMGHHFGFEEEALRELGYE